MQTLLIFVWCIAIHINVINSLLEYSHKEGEKLKIGNGLINSIETQLPFKYSYSGFCAPQKEVKIHDDLGKLLSGQTVYESLYEITINKNETCKVLCEVNVTAQMLKRFKWLIEHKYRAMYYLDKLPSAKGFYNILTNETVYDYQDGIPLGESLTSTGLSDQDIVYNHLSFEVAVHKVKDTDEYEIVGFNVFPLSLTLTDEDIEQCSSDNGDGVSNNVDPRKFVKMHRFISENQTLKFTYDVHFIESNLTLVSRWDHYIHLKAEIHWIGIINANIILFTFAFIVICIFFRALGKDIALYNTKVTFEDAVDEVGWKQVCNDVFRKPQRSMLFSSLIGSGMQLFAMLFTSILIGALGFWKPEHRNNLLSLMIFLFVLMGLYGGYISSRVYKIFRGANWLKNALLTAVIYPAALFAVITIINIFFAAEKSSGTISIKTMFSLVVLWICCSCPLVLIGAFFGIKRKPIKLPCRINTVPTMIPNKPWYLKIRFMIWIGGLISFAAVVLEYNYIMDSLWRHQVFYLFGFMWIAVIALVVVSGEISIIVVYLCLCKGDYNWWWKSFFMGGSSTLFFILYAVYNFFNLNIVRFSTMFIYFGTMAIISSVTFLICGSTSVLINFYFLSTIYSKIRID
jgi:transmembrane 9 superfamily protein 2/4